MYCIFIHSSVDENLGYFHVLTTVKSVTINIGVHVSFWILIISPNPTNKDQLIKWTGEVSNTLIQVWCLKILHYIFHIFHFSEKVSWAWQVHILRWMVCPVKKTVWHIKYFVYLILFVLLDFYISLFSWLLSATSVLHTVQFSLNILPLMFPERMCGEWIWQIWTNPSMSSLQLYYFPGNELL